MTHESRGALASHSVTRDLRLLTCGCGQQYETRADEPAETCPACTRERNLRCMRANNMRRAEKIAEAHKEWVVMYDPCDTPMRPGAKLSQMEIDCGLRFDAFALGMRLCKHGRVYVVTPAGLEAH